MRKLRNEVTYAVACVCEKCRKESGRDFEILGCLHPSKKEAQKEQETYRTSRHFPTFIVKETIEPLHQISQRKRKAA